MKKCLKCGYERRDTDTAPLTECPQCGVIYSKAKKPVRHFTNTPQGSVKNKKGFLENLFDVSFSEFVTTQIVKILYIMILILSGIGAIGMVIGGFSSSTGSGFGMLLLAPLAFFIQVLFARISLELIIVVFKIAENTSHFKDRN